MNKRIKTLLSLAVIAVVALAALPASAATTSSSATAPEVDNFDIANYIDSGHLDKWFCIAGEWASRPVGQTITVGSDNALLNSITYQIADSQKSPPVKTYTIRVCTIEKVDPDDSDTWILTEIYSETATQTETPWVGANGLAAHGLEPSPFMTWTFDTPVLLLANTEYGIDVGMNSSSVGWGDGIAYLKYSNTNQYDGGTRYWSGQRDTQTGQVPGLGSELMNNVGGERIFHVDMVPADQTLPGVVIDTPGKYTWSGQEIVLDATVTNNAGDPNFPETQPPLEYIWTAEPDGIGNDDLDVVITGDTLEDAAITITKNTSIADVVTVKVTLSVINTGVDKMAMTDSITIDVYDNACLMGEDLELIVYDDTDLNTDCVTNIADFAMLAADWLADYATKIPKPNPIQ